MNDIKYIGGSYGFFKDYKDYNELHHDLDYIIITDDTDSIYKHIHNNKDCYFYWKKNATKSEIIKFLKHKHTIFTFTCLLNPEFVHHYHITIEDIKQYDEFFNRCVSKNKYKYQTLIYNAYIENNDFILTQDQRDKAFEEYKKYKNQFKLDLTRDLR